MSSSFGISCIDFQNTISIFPFFPPSQIMCFLAGCSAFLIWVWFLFYFLTLLVEISSFYFSLLFPYTDYCNSFLYLYMIVVKNTFRILTLLLSVLTFAFRLFLIIFSFFCHPTLFFFTFYFKCVRQEYILFSYLFNIYKEHI